RILNPERSREHERRRAWLRRRHGSRIEKPDGNQTIFSYPSGASYQRYENEAYIVEGECGCHYSTQERARRRSADIGRPASRSRQYMKQLRKRIEAKRARLAAIDEELGLPADASLEDRDRALLTYQGDKLDELLGISGKIAKLNESAA